jgi:hypothetical protein
MRQDTSGSTDVMSAQYMGASMIKLDIVMGTVW